MPNPNRQARRGTATSQTGIGRLLRLLLATVAGCYILYVVVGVVATYEDNPVADFGDIPGLVWHQASAPAVQLGGWLTETGGSTDGTRTRRIATSASNSPASPVTPPPSARREIEGPHFNGKYDDYATYEEMMANDSERANIEKAQEYEALTAQAGKALNSMSLMALLPDCAPKVMEASYELNKRETAILASAGMDEASILTLIEELFFPGSPPVMNTFRWDELTDEEIDVLFEVTENGLKTAEKVLKKGC